MSMYLPFFRLAQAPFTIAPDPRYLFMSERHREALAHLLYGVGSGGGIVLLTGEIGAGKTTVCRCFLEQIPADCRVAYIFNPRLTVTELLQTICAEFGVAPTSQNGSDARPTLNHYFNALNDYLLKSHAGGGKNVLIIDEAQNLTADVLEQLRLLTNLETSQTKLLQIILIGQPELRTMVARPELEQLAQRIIARYHLGSLSRDETALYIAHRLAVAGSAGIMPFSLKTMHLIHRLCDGVPRRINLLCDRALLGAYTEGRQHVSSAVVRRAAQEVFGQPEHAVPEGRRQWWRGAAIGAGAVATVAVVGMASAAWWTGDRSVTPSARLATWWSAANGPGNPSTSSPSSSGQGGDSTGGPAAQTSGTQVAGATSANLSSTGAAGRPLPASSGKTVDVLGASNPAVSPAPAAASTSATGSAVAPVPAPAAVPNRPAVLASNATTELATAAPLTDPDWLARQAAQPPVQLLPALAGYWGVTLAAGDPCTAAQLSGLHCYVGRGGLAELRQLNRPAVLSLRDARQIRPVLLLALDGQRALLRLDGKSWTLDPSALQDVMTGEFATFWRAPQAYRDYLRTGDQGADVDWLAGQLARARGEKDVPAGQTFDVALIQRLREFQQARGLVADGVAGPRTFMTLNQLAGSNEPQLRPASVGSSPARSSVTEK